MVTAEKDALALYIFDQFSLISEEEIQQNISLTQLIIQKPQEIVSCLHPSLLCFQQILGQQKSPMDTTACAFPTHAVELNADATKRGATLDSHF
ncbi:hypothetical protein llap_11879 [Limosa lapponica baueri]|uniref:Uncharacterized protein n=1 Tax=Limosa lapponica baueri TaxID=1758121 RepID=A0A2I0TVJ1_LIMLA|nr:hypothetical protein llap_11879 [Limosa lapponica baueri]